MGPDKRFQWAHTSSSKLHLVGRLKVHSLGMPNPWRAHGRAALRLVVTRGHVEYKANTRPQVGKAVCWGPLKRAWACTGCLCQACVCAALHCTPLCLVLPLPWCVAELDAAGPCAQDGKNERGLERQGKQTCGRLLFRNHGRRVFALAADGGHVSGQTRKAVAGVLPTHKGVLAPLPPLYTASVLAGCTAACLPAQPMSIAMKVPTSVDVWQPCGVGLSSSKAKGLNHV